jgi:hypothetical protein
MGPGAELGGAGQPAGEVAFETLLVDITRAGAVDVLTCWFIHYVIFEEDCSGVQQARHTSLPLSGAVCLGFVREPAVGW